MNRNKAGILKEWRMKKKKMKSLLNNLAREEIINCDS